MPISPVKSNFLYLSNQDVAVEVVGISKVENEEELKEKLKEAKSEYIIQEYMAGEDFDADVYRCNLE